jgi:SAM-dependent methyltransferase
MHKHHLQYLVCPQCRGTLSLVRGDGPGETIESGEIGCAACSRRYDILRGVPRFVPRDNYASGFGLEWSKHARTQFDSYSGAPVSENRFFNETKWPRRLPGELILEVGSGSGRFTEQAASTGATVASLDYSYAVDANYASNGHLANVLIVQADLYNMPFPQGAFDRLFCLGVIQHTPYPENAFLGLPSYLKPGGNLAVDIYKQSSGLRGAMSRLVPSKYWVRPLSRRMDPEALYRRVKAYIDFMWPIARVIHCIPKIGPWLNWRLVIADYRGVYPLEEEILKEWALLDTFDMLSPRYDYPQTMETVQRWFEKAGLQDVEIHFGYNGIEGRGRRPG